MTLHPIHLNFLIYEENFVFFFISVHTYADPFSQAVITLGKWLPFQMQFQSIMQIVKVKLLWISQPQLLVIHDDKPDKYSIRGWDLAELWMRPGRVWMRPSRAWMRPNRVVTASDSQCRSRVCPGFDPSILRHSGIWGAADEAVLNILHKKIQKNSPIIFCTSADKKQISELENKRSRPESCCPTRLPPHHPIFHLSHGYFI